MVEVRSDPWPVAGAPASGPGTGTIREKVGRVLRERILTGQLAPGSRIDLDVVATELGTSRTPVREACLELMYDGIVRVAPRSGIIVLGVTPEGILENFALMAALSGVAAEWAAERIEPSELQRVRALRVEVAVAVRTGGDIATTNWQFHREVNRACKSARLLTVLGAAGRMIPRSFFDVFPEHIPCSLEEHDELVSALGRRDGRAARDVAEHHLKAAAALLSSRVSAMRAEQETHTSAPPEAALDARTGDGPR